MAEKSELGDHQLTFILGGARSGKSTHAEALVTLQPPPWTYIATAQIRDGEMADRIAEHQRRRDERWQLIEANLELPEILGSLPDDRPVLIDCLTLWLSNVMLAELDLIHKFDELIDVLSKPRGPWFVVSNEVGQGIVPDNALARNFRDEAGRLNQRVAAIADRVEFVTAGLPHRLK